MDTKTIQKREEYKQRLDKLNNFLWTSGLSDPINRIQQMSFLFFLKMIEEQDNNLTKESELTKRAYKSIFSGDNEKYRWSKWVYKSGEGLLKFVRDEVFPFMARLRNAHPPERSRAGDNIRKIFRDARLVITDPSVLKNALEIIDEIKFYELDADVKGDLYEDLLTQIRAAGELGQFLTPRHIIRYIVEMVNPKIGQAIYDPCCGTGGFLIAAYEHIKTHNSSKDQIEQHNDTKHGPGDKLTNQQWEYLQHKTFFGQDVDIGMERLTLMNLFLHGLEESDIKRKDTIAGAEDDDDLRKFDIILTNPPFAGKINKERIKKSLPIKSAKTQILILGNVIDSLNTGGIAGIILPEGVLFGTQRDDKEIRRYLLEKTHLEAVVSMPGGVFQPYAGVKASVLIFTKGKPTQEVWFYDMKGDGSSLSSAHKFGPQYRNDIPDLLKKWHDKAKSDQSWTVPVKDIIENDYILSANAYNPNIGGEEKQHRPPIEILKEISQTQKDLSQGLDKIKGFLS